MNRFEFWKDVTVVELVTEGVEKEVLQGEERQRWAEVNATSFFSNDILFPKEIVLYSSSTGKNKRYTIEQLSKLLGVDRYVIMADLRVCSYSNNVMQCINGPIFKRIFYWDLKRPVTLLDIPDMSNYDSLQIAVLGACLYAAYTCYTNLFIKDDKLMFDANYLQRKQNGVPCNLLITDIANLPKSFLATIPDAKTGFQVSIKPDTFIKLLSPRAKALLRIGFIVNTLKENCYGNNSEYVDDRAKLRIDILHDVKLKNVDDNEFIVIKTNLVESGSIEINYKDLISINHWSTNAYLSLGDHAYSHKPSDDDFGTADL